MKTKHLGSSALSLLTILSLLLMPAANVNAQAIPSDKAFFASNSNELTIFGSGDITEPILTGQMKTSAVGDLLIGVSMECALWTDTNTTATKGGGKVTSSARAAVNVTVKVDGVDATPGQVVYCDRTQTVSLAFSSLTVLTTDSITLDLFLQTKNANHFNFFAPGVTSSIHTIQVFASGFIVTDPSATVGNTRAVIGKRTLVVQRINNTNI